MKNAAIDLAKDLNDERLARSVHMKIKRYFTDVNGTIIAAPAAMQTRYPVYLFGEFDRQGGYKQALQICPPENGTFFLCSFVQGFGFTTANIVGFSGANDLLSGGRIKTGDLVFVFTDNLQNPNTYVWIVQDASKVSIASILANIKTTQKDNKYNRLWADEVVYTTTNNNTRQWDEVMHVTKLNNLGLAKDNDFAPLLYKTPYTFLNFILEMGLKFYVDQFIGFNTYMQYATDEIQFIFKLKI